MRRVALGFALVGLAGCSGTGSSASDVFAGNPHARPVPIPNAVSGGVRGGTVVDPSTQPPDPAALEATARQREAAAAALWRRAEAIEARDPEEAADLYGELAESYPETPNAAEALFRKGRGLFRAGEYSDASRALQSYMATVPVNPHLAEVEELIYRSGVLHLRTNTGVGAIFVTDGPGIEALKYVPEHFPAGNYADDALLALARYYVEDDDPVTAALHYRELLLRHPDSEWSFQARLGLGDAYMTMDQGSPYEGGFVDIDPREPPEGEREAIMAGPVRSGVAAALQQYELFLRRMEADPIRAREYGADIEYARRRRAEARERLAGKDLFRAEWYRGRGNVEAARTYYASAATWNDTPSGRAAAERLAALGPATGTAPARVVVVQGPAPRPPGATAPVEPRPPPPTPAWPPPSTPPSTPPPPPPPPPPSGDLPPPQASAR